MYFLSFISIYFKITSQKIYREDYEYTNFGFSNLFIGKYFRLRIIYFLNVQIE